MIVNPEGVEYAFLNIQWGGGGKLITLNSTSSYSDMISQCSVVSLEANKNTKHFERVFVSFKACLDGFKKCRPMLFMDGTFMIGRAKGTLLAATAKDGDNDVVSAENASNWVWFLEKLREIVHHDKEICYISNRNTGLMSAFPMVFGKPLHLFCIFHLLGNFRVKLTSGWTNTQRETMGVHFKNCAYAPNIRISNEKLEIFKREGGKAAEDWISQIPFDKWAVAHSRHIKIYGEMTSNAAEQFNKWIKEARALLITYMIDHIRSGIATWHVQRRHDSKEWTGVICPIKEMLWHQLTAISRTWPVIELSSGKFEVLSRLSVEVDLSERTCSCHQWRVMGFPCAHAVAVMQKNCNSVYNLIKECAHASSYRACYSFDIQSVPETERFEFHPD
ncbi:hypothetical protein OROHE_006071 [Orobanche hederae]